MISLLCFTVTGSAFAADIAPLKPNALRGEVNAHVGNIPETETPGRNKDVLVDKGDFYYLKDGKIKSFFRSENTHFIIYRDISSQITAENELQKKFADDLDIIRDHRLKRLTKLKIKEGRNRGQVISSVMSSDPSISFISPALKSKDKGGEIALTPRIVVRLAENTNPSHAISELSRNNLLFLSFSSSSNRELIMEVDDAPNLASRIFQVTRQASALPFIEWAEPDFVISSRSQFMPNDPLFNSQWHLHNTGQNGSVSDSDVDAPGAWDISLGTGAVIAVYDDGTDTGHEDINIWSNPGETGLGKESNGIDDDGNGYIDDYQGWDFNDGDNDPSPSSSGDNHGTSVSGVAGASGNNGIGVSGSSQGAYILPVRMNSGACSTFADAMRYAGKYSDVVNNSWGIDACESNIDSAISDVVNGSITGARRGTLGTPVLFATGNSASGWTKFTLSGISAGTHTFQWRYIKDMRTTAGYDTVWIDNIIWPGGSQADFESDVAGNIPSGFTSSGQADWTVVSDGVHARGASGNSVKAGTIGRNQQTNLDITRTVTGGTLTFWAWVSSEQNFDFFDFYFNGVRYFHYSPGQNGHVNEVGYPASNPDTIAVGASTDGAPGSVEERSYYSQFGPELDLVAPSNGGGQEITTTDRTGAAGYSSTNYTSDFGGTSSATPLVAGITAAIITDNPSLTSGEVRTILRDSADQIGPYAYSSGRNDYYGYGRVNFFNALCPDSDGDGYRVCIDDCNDNNGAINPGASETCNSIDDNCNDITDEGFDNDGDTYTSCGGDCNDSDSSINPDTLWYQDNDEDGYGNPSISLQQCTEPPGPILYVLNSDDYNDSDPFIYPGGPPVRVNGSSLSYHMSLQSAYNAAGDGDTIQVQTGTYIETLNCSSPISVTFEGGYGNDYTTNNDYSILNGNMTISDGLVTVGDFVISP